MISTPVMTQEEANVLLNQYNVETASNTSTDTLDYGLTYKKNQEIIDACDVMILERITSGDPSVKVSEVNSTRAEAFKQNQLIKGGATANINFNINMIENSSADELFELLNQLND